MITTDDIGKLAEHRGGEIGVIKKVEQVYSDRTIVTINGTRGLVTDYDNYFYLMGRLG